MDTSLTGFYSDPATKAMREPAPKLTTDDQLQSARQQLTEAGKSKGMLKQAQAQESAEQAKILSEADVNTRKKFAESVENDPFKKAWEEKTKEASDTKFVPTQETAGDLGLLFTLTNILGFAIGAKSKGNAQAAMSAMNGMLEGHQKGRQDIYKQEKDKFDENFKTLDKTIQSLKTQYESAMKTYANNREQGMAEARMAVAEHNARFIQDSLEKFGPAYAYDQIRDTVSMLEKAKAAEQKLQDAEERRKETERRDAETARSHRETEALRREQMGLTKTLAQDRQGKGEIFQGKDGAMYRVTPDNKVVKIEGSEGFSKPGSMGKTGAAQTTAQNVLKEDVDNAAYNFDRIRELSQGKDKLPGGSVAFANAFKGDLTSDIGRYLTGQTISPDLQGMDALMLNTAFDIASAQTGGRGQLSDSKVRAVVSQFPLDSEPEESKREKWAALITRLESANKLLPEDKRTDTAKLREFFGIQKGGGAGKPTLQQFLEKAKVANPNATEADLTKYYNEKYGNR